MDRVARKTKRLWVQAFVAAVSGSDAVPGCRGQLDRRDLIEIPVLNGIGFDDFPVVWQMMGRFIAQAAGSLHRASSIPAVYGAPLLP
jgi:hypothetical protein